MLIYNINIVNITKDSTFSQKLYFSSRGGCKEVQKLILVICELPHGCLEKKRVVKLLAVTFLVNKKMSNSISYPFLFSKR